MCVDTTCNLEETRQIVDVRKTLRWKDSLPRNLKFESGTFLLGVKTTAKKYFFLGPTKIKYMYWLMYTCMLCIQMFKHVYMWSNSFKFVLKNAKTK